MAFALPPYKRHIVVDSTPPENDINLFTFLLVPEGVDSKYIFLDIFYTHIQIRYWAGYMPSPLLVGLKPSFVFPLLRL